MKDANGHQTWKLEKATKTVRQKRVGNRLRASGAKKSRCERPWQDWQGATRVQLIQRISKVWSWKAVQRERTEGVSAPARNGEGRLELALVCLFLHVKTFDWHETECQDTKAHWTAHLYTVFRVIISLSWWMPSSTQHESIETLYTIKWHLLEASIVAIPSVGWKWWPTQWHGLINRECMACLENLALRVLKHQEGHSRYSSCECRG